MTDSKFNDLSDSMKCSSNLGLSVGKEDELTPEPRQDDTSPGAGRVDSTQIELAKLELENEL